MNQTGKQTAMETNEPQRLNDVLDRLLEFDSGGLPVFHGSIFGNGEIASTRSSGGRRD